MRVLVQRVKEAAVTVEGREIGAIGLGYLLLVGFAPSDTPAQVTWMADKIVGLRLFPDDDGLMNRDLGESGGQLLVVSQFTLYGDAAKGRRPSFIGAARPETAIPLYTAFIAELTARGHAPAIGEFGAEMQVSLINDGPVTLMLEKDAA